VPTSITKRSMRLVLSAAAAASLVGGCVYPSEGGPNWPITQRQQSFNELDAALAGSAPAVADAVTGDRIARARSEPHNWLTYYGTYDGQRFSSLDQINTANVANLRPAWQFQAAPLGLLAAPATYSFEAAPIVVDGVMYVSGWSGYVWAFNAATGEELWRYQHAVPLDVPLCCGDVNRGVAVARGRVFYSTQDGILYALDARTGQPVWKQAWLDPRAGESSTMAPLIVKTMVIVGSSGAEYGVRGHIDAFDIETGRRIWRRYPVPKPGELGSETWGNDEAWQHGGGSAWITGTYDPELDILYWGTSNPSPDLDGRKRPGDNLYTDSVLAMDPDDGTIRWHYQFTPHDVWDYSGVNENILFEEGGRRLLAHFDKNGYLFILDRATGERVNITQFYDRASWGRIDPGTGAVTARREPTEQGVEVCPGPAGAKEWTHATFSGQTRLLYVPVIDACATYRRFETPMKESLSHWGGDYTVAPEQVHGGGVKAYRTDGSLAWEWRSKMPIVASLLSTAGGLIFVGTPTGEFIALDARNGRQLWQFRTGSGIHSSPISYSVGGTQYVAVPTGWGGWVKGFAPQTFGRERGSTLFAFSLAGGAPGAAQSTATSSR
jgi:alcohol dehydrogenase (cytochrome c)